MKNPTEIPVIDRTAPTVWESPDGGRLLYRVHVPAGAKGKLPLCVFLHGAGERGDDNAKQLFHCAKDLVDYADTVEPAVCVFPQCPEGAQWVDLPWAETGHTQPAEPSPQARMALELIEFLKTSLPIDASRVYLCGISMGGYGTWDLVSRRSDLFAAAMPVCGGGDAAVAAKKLADFPLWVVHGGADTVVPTQNSRELVVALRAAGSKRLVYTEWAGVGHDSWSRTFANRSNLDWLFSHRKSAL